MPGPDRETADERVRAEIDVGKAGGGVYETCSDAAGVSGEDDSLTRHGRSPRVPSRPGSLRRGLVHQDGADAPVAEGAVGPAQR